MKVITNLFIFSFSLKQMLIPSLHSNCMETILDCIHRMLYYILSTQPSRDKKILKKIWKRRRRKTINSCSPLHVYNWNRFPFHAKSILCFLSPPPLFFHPFFSLWFPLYKDKTYHTSSLHYHYFFSFFPLQFFAGWVSSHGSPSLNLGLYTSTNSSTTSCKCRILQRNRKGS